MQLILAIPLAARLALVFVVAAVLASLANAVIYHFAWERRLRSPWQPKPPELEPRTWSDCIPIVGWWFLRREAPHHGHGHWIRPMLIELAFPLGLAWLYWWETEALGLIAEQALGNIGAFAPDQFAVATHLEFLAHAVLMWFMLAATFIDADDRIIPDIITVPGTIFGLILATLAPLALLPQITMPPVPPVAGQQLIDKAGAATKFYLEPVHLAAASDWPAELAAAPNWKSLVLALACYWLWCFAFVRRSWLRRRGLVRAVRHFLTRVGSDWWTTPLREVTAIGTVLVVAVWWWGGAAWVGLLTSLVGLVGAGGVVWLIRIIASPALGKEAMGFGDVLLMMMIGTLIGWQAGVIVFFLAPFAALVYGLVQLIVRKENELPYGPFLCAATVFLIVRWASVWNWGSLFFQRPILVLVVLAVCLILCGAILAVYQGLKNRILGAPEAE
ncbi:A24 family peptidase [Aeoliella sp. ICT_H6.2]|uniref:A24 family peptidase n=1 Tax=Aeoliella straminimaris TaxID=2954799 RepID=A0A9X2FEI9_9BACT|nr:A24 family peptidase [Aeoliella straminimaris]MCO6047687.1 A24 family peptidase [Aeoliella straminimaris]